MATINIPPTTIIRRIDDMGRICIPKEFRKALKLTNDSPVEMYVNKGNLMLWKWEPEEHLKNDVQILMDAVADSADDLGENRTTEILTKLIEVKKML